MFALDHIEVRRRNDGNYQNLAVRHLADACAIGAARPGLGLDHIHSHDFRRTVAAGRASIGINAQTISLVLDHTGVNEGDRYRSCGREIFVPPKKRGALECWANRL